MKTATYRPCRKRVTMAAVVGALVLSAPALLASGNSTSQPAATTRTAEQLECPAHGKAGKLGCVLRSLDHRPPWLKWAIYAWLIGGLSYVVVKRLASFWTWLQSEAPKHENDDRKL